MSQSTALPAPLPHPREGETLFGFWWRHHRRAVESTQKTFGVSRELLEVVFRDPLWRAANQVCMRLDDVFFPTWRAKTVREPVFIVGHPRSGTTMLQRCLTQADDFVEFQLWHLLFPSLTERRLIGPLVRNRIRKGTDVLVPGEVGHSFVLGEVDEEELLFLFHAMTQFYPVLSGLAFSEEDFEEIVFCDALPASLRRESMTWLDGCLRRQMLFTGRDRVVAKMNYSAMRIRTLLEAYPDARVVYLVRSPLDTIPSHLSLHRNVLAHRVDLGRLPPGVLERYLRRRYEHNVSFYRYVEDALASGDLPASRVTTVRYDDMMGDLEGVVARVGEFAHIDYSAELLRKVAEQGEKQRRYVRRHENQDLQAYGLTREQILQDLGFIFDRYGFDRGV